VYDNGHFNYANQTGDNKKKWCHRSVGTKRFLDRNRLNFLHQKPFKQNGSRRVSVRNVSFGADAHSR